jgi:hypothetical protein
MKTKNSKIYRSTEWASIDERGGYIVHPVPAQSQQKKKKLIKKEKGNNQKLTLFKRGKAYLVLL